MTRQSRGMIYYRIFMKNYYIYILASKKDGVLYVGMTNNLYRRIIEHKEGRGSKFTKKYDIKQFVYFETYIDPTNAIKREKQIKAGSRKKKIELIEKRNPDWDDITEHILYS